MAGYSSSSTLVISPPPVIPQITNEEQPNYLALPCDNGFCNNFLLQQDPQTGHLTLLPVQIAELQPITGVGHFSAEPLNIKLPNPLCSVKSDVSIRNERGCVSHREHDSAVSPERAVNITAPHCLNHTLTLTSSCQRCPCPQRLADLLSEEFAFDSCMENGVEDLAMGNCLFK